MLQLASLSEEQRDTWIGRVRVGAIVYAGIVALSGLIFVIATLAGGAFGQAFLGLVATVGGLLVAGLVWGICRYAYAAIEAIEEIRSLHERLDMLESTVELHSAQAGLSATLVDDLSALVAGKLQQARYPRIVSDEDEGEPDLTEAESAERAEAIEEETAAVASRDPVVLRAEFGDLVRNHQYADALSKGRQIASMFPESRMATDFENIRSHLERRVVKQVAQAKLGS